MRSSGGRSKKKGRGGMWVVGEKKGKKKKMKRWCTWVVGKKGKKKIIIINNVIIKENTFNKDQV